jgi:hypothetical protein
VKKKSYISYMFKIRVNPSPQSNKKQSATSAYQSHVNYVKQSVFTHNPNYEPMWLKTYMTYIFKNITEVVYVRSFQDDKFESKFAEVDYEIPP